MTSLVIFDLDGTLIDSEELAARALAEELTRAGFPITTEEVVARFVGVANAALARSLERENGRRLPEDFRDRTRRRMQSLFAAELRAIAGVEAALAQITLPRCVASNSSSAYIARNLGLTGLAAHFGPETQFSADMVARPKPAPDVYLHAAETMRTAPQDCLVIEDSVAGVTAARAAGMTVLGFAGAGHITDRDAHGARLRDAGARQTFHDYSVLSELLA